jgi:hypothetical protein
MILVCGLFWSQLIFLVTLVADANKVDLNGILSDKFKNRYRFAFSFIRLAARPRPTPINRERHWQRVRRAVSVYQECLRESQQSWSVTGNLLSLCYISILEFTFVGIEESKCPKPNTQ